jgi:hypothetical protein
LAAGKSTSQQRRQHRTASGQRDAGIAAKRHAATLRYRHATKTARLHEISIEQPWAARWQESPDDL